MKIFVPNGKYIVAVSGGIDSMALLDILSKQAGLELVVAHFNHGIRKDTDKDEKLVKQAAHRYDLPIEIGHGQLGPNTSEEKARDARYKFLRSVQKKLNADSLVTAHHEDDVIETAILNLIRGTGRRGLSSIKDNPDILRPLLTVSKKEILSYAKEHDIKWREDPSNSDESYLRNYIRHRLVPETSAEERKQFLKAINNTAAANKLIDQEIATLSQNIIKDNCIDRSNYIGLPIEVANEVMMRFLRSNGLGQFDKHGIGRLTVSVRTAKPGSNIDINSSASLNITKSEAQLVLGVRA